MLVGRRQRWGNGHWLRRLGLEDKGVGGPAAFRHIEGRQGGHIGRPHRYSSRVVVSNGEGDRSDRETFLGVAGRYFRALQHDRFVVLVHVVVFRLEAQQRRAVHLSGGDHDLERLDRLVPPLGVLDLEQLEVLESGGAGGGERHLDGGVDRPGVRRAFRRAGVTRRPAHVGEGCRYGKEPPPSVLGHRAEGVAVGRQDQLHARGRNVVVVLDGDQYRVVVADQLPGLCRRIAQLQLERFVVLHQVVVVQGDGEVKAGLARPQHHHHSVLGKIEVSGLSRGLVRRRRREVVLRIQSDQEVGVVPPGAVQVDGEVHGAGALRRRVGADETKAGGWSVGAGGGRFVQDDDNASPRVVVHHHSLWRDQGDPESLIRFFNRIANDVDGDVLARFVSAKGDPAGRGGSVHIVHSVHR